MIVESKARFPTRTVHVTTQSTLGTRDFGLQDYMYVVQWYISSRDLLLQTVVIAASAASEAQALEMNTRSPFNNDDRTKRFDQESPIWQ